MATASFTHKLVIDNDRTAQKFLDAVEKSAKRNNNTPVYDIDVEASLQRSIELLEKQYSR